LKIFGCQVLIIAHNYSWSLSENVFGVALKNLVVSSTMVRFPPPIIEKKLIIAWVTKKFQIGFK